MFLLTIRDVFWASVVALVAFVLGGGWFVHTVRYDVENSRLRSRLQQTEGHLKELQRILKENGLEDPGYYYW
jgi:hypothetical protein